MHPFTRIRVLVVAALLLALAGCASTSGGGAGGFFDDTAITTRVKKAIYDEPTLKVSDVSVKTNEKVVQLSGSVKSRAEVRKAGEVAGKVEGVKRVQNDLHIKP